MININVDVPPVGTQKTNTFFNSTPYPKIELASNKRYDDYGGIGEDKGSVMRNNFISRLKNILTDEDNVKGRSSGGANYVKVLYDPVDPDNKSDNPYSCGGFRRYSDAYGKNEGVCVVNFDEY